MNPTVAIIIPHRDQPELLAICLNSCVAQTLAAREILVVDDGSVRAPDEIVARYRDRVKLLKLPRPQGPAAARNAGLRETTAELVQFIDADDYLHPEKLALQVPLLADPSVDFVVADWRVVFDLGVKLPMPRRKMGPREGLSTATIANQQRYFPVMAAVVRRSFLERIGPWREDLAWCEDRDFRYRMLRDARGIAFVDRCLFYYRRGTVPTRSQLPLVARDGDRIVNDVEEEFLNLVLSDLRDGRIDREEGITGLRGLVSTALVRSQTYRPEQKARADEMARRTEAALRECGDTLPPPTQTVPKVHVRSWAIALIRKGIDDSHWFRLNLVRQHTKQWIWAWTRTAAVAFHAVLRRLGRKLGKIREAVAPFDGAVVNYHRVGKTSPYTEKLGITLPLAEFRTQIAYLTRNFEVVPFSVFSASRKRSRKVAVTIDDGYVDVLRTILPIMEEFRCPFKVYLNAEQVDGTLGWLNKLSFILTRLSAEETKAFAREAVPHASLQHPGEVAEYRRLFEFPTTLEVVERRYAELHRGMVEPKLFLSKDEVLALKDHPLIEWGSHTLAHLPLDRLPAAERRRQVKDGHSRLQAILGDRLQGFALPFGNAPLRRPEAADLVAEVDRYFVMATHSRLLQRRVGDLVEIDRVAGDAGISSLRSKLERRKPAA